MVSRVGISGSEPELTLSLKSFESSKRGLYFAAAVFILMFAFLLASPLHLVSRFRLGYAITNTLQGADRVETFHVISPEEARNPELFGKPKVNSANAPRIEYCYLTDTGPTQGKAFADQIRDVLLDESTSSKDSLGRTLLPLRGDEHNFL